MNSILSLITSSFLSEKDKEAMKSVFQQRGADEAFFQAFNKLLIDELRRRGKEFQVSVEAFDQGSLRIEREYHSKIEYLEKHLDQTLTSLAPDDVAKKEALWREYYAAVEAARATYEDAMKGLASDVIKQATT